MQKELIISAGIDIGTSTTKMVFSELEVQNTAGYGVVPRIEITNKHILHRSPIYRTPLLDEDVIDTSAIQRLVLSEYVAAGLTPAQIQTGAILITGETATKRNAAEVVHTLANESGDFLVATAGADLEGILAAKGSGAYEYSGKYPSVTVANIDIGGGTANIAVMKNKQLLGTCTLHVGGRLVEFHEQFVQTIAPPIQRWMLVNDIGMTKETLRTGPEIQCLIDQMVDSLWLAISKTITSNHPFLLGHEPNWTGQVDTLMFSGGVAMYLQDGRQEYEDDIGWFIAQAIRKSQLYRDFEVVMPEETVAATVIGTSTQTTEISGATIHVAQKDLPIKNCPVVTVDFVKCLQNVEQQIAQIVRQANDVFRLQSEPTTVAWFMKSLPRLSFRDVEFVAQSFINEITKLSLPGLPYVFIFQQDFGRVFGQTILRLQPEATIISIDQINIEQGDYIDIGNVLEAGVVPVVVKTLAFQGK